MVMKTCRECRKEVSSQAVSCPHCGAVLKRQTGVFMSLLAVALLCVLAAIIYSRLNARATSPSTKPEAGLKLPSFGSQIVTFDEYKRVEDGMSYQQVVSIIGAQGEETVRNRLEGDPDVMESVDTVMYQWVNSNGSNMNAMFQNDKLVLKAQFGLK